MTVGAADAISQDRKTAPPPGCRSRGWRPRSPRSILLPPGSAVSVPAAPPAPPDPAGELSRRKVQCTYVPHSRIHGKRIRHARSHRGRRHRRHRRTPVASLTPVAPGPARGTVAEESGVRECRRHECKSERTPAAGPAATSIHARRLLKPSSPSSRISPQHAILAERGPSPTTEPVPPNKRPLRPFPRHPGNHQRWSHRPPNPARPQSALGEVVTKCAIHQDDLTVILAMNGRPLAVTAVATVSAIPRQHEFRTVSPSTAFASGGLVRHKSAVGEQQEAGPIMNGTAGAGPTPSSIPTVRAEELTDRACPSIATRHLVRRESHLHGNQCAAIVEYRPSEAGFTALLEPVSGIEPPTYGLRNRCSATELHWLPRGRPGKSRAGHRLGLVIASADLDASECTRGTRHPPCFYSGRGRAILAAMYRVTRLGMD
jgi:hypothetical protein